MDDTVVTAVRRENYRLTELPPQKVTSNTNTARPEERERSRAVAVFAFPSTYLNYLRLSLFPVKTRVHPPPSSPPTLHEHPHPPPSPPRVGPPSHRAGCAGRLFARASCVSVQSPRCRVSLPIRVIVIFLSKGYC